MLNSALSGLNVINFAQGMADPTYPMLRDSSLPGDMERGSLCWRSIEKSSTAPDLQQPVRRRPAQRLQCTDADPRERSLGQH